MKNKTVNRIIGTLLCILILFLVYSFVEYDLKWIFNLKEDEENRYVIIMMVVFSVILNVIGDPVKFVKTSKN